MHKCVRKSCKLEKIVASVGEEYVEKIMKLPQVTIDVIAIDIFYFKSINDLEKYF